jgi:hypothetical protein
MKTYNYIYSLFLLLGLIKLIGGWSLGSIGGYFEKRDLYSRYNSKI